MTASVGSFSNSSNLFYFSSCSITAFKKTLLTSNKNSTNSNGSCLLNSPASPFISVASAYKYPGQFYSLPQQCQLAIGKSSTAAGCNVFNIIKKLINFLIFFYNSIDRVNGR